MTDLSPSKAVPAVHFGRLERHQGGQAMHFERHLAHPAAAVFRALTEDDQLAEWFPTTVEGAREVGAPLRFVFQEMDIPAMEGEVLAYEPDRLFAFRWGPDTVRFELEPDGPDEQTTLLTLHVEFDELGKGARDGAGWHCCLDDLGALVDGTLGPRDSGEQWRAVHPGYIERFGPEASTLGPPEEWETVHGERAGADPDVPGSA